MPQASEPAREAVQSPTPKAADAFDVADLFRGRTEIRLLHRGAEYRLRVTRQGKLILTK